MRAVLLAALLLFASACFASPAEEARLAAQRGDYEAALELLKPLAEAGDVDALGNVGNMYALGQGIEPDLNAAYSFWLRAADKHLSSAMFNIGNLYMSGRGDFPQDIKQAAAWYKRAAEHRHVTAMLNVSALYASGEGGLEKDRTHALAWAALAASNARSAEQRQRAVMQARAVGGDMSLEERKRAQEISNELVRVIDENVRKYKQQ